MQENHCKTCGEIYTGSTLGYKNWCRPCRNEYHRARRKQPGAQTQARKARLRRYRNRQWELVEAYGGACKCCGERNPAFLVIDHVDSDGKEHRKKFKYNVPAKLRQLGYPQVIDGYRVQLLCYNCNMAKAHLGQCPHVEAGKGIPKVSVLEANGNPFDGYD